MVLKTAKCLRSAWRRIKMPIYSLWQTPGHSGQHFIPELTWRFLSKIQNEMTLPSQILPSNPWIKIKNMMMHGMCSWLMFCFCQCWWGVGHEWCWRPAQAPTTDHPNLTDQHTQCLAMHFNDKRFSLLSSRLTNTWSIHGGRTYQQPSCCPSDHPFRMTTHEVGGARDDHQTNQLTSD